MAQVQKQHRKPSRMVLSPRVASPSTKASDQVPRSSGKPKDGPFGAMNRTDAGGLVPPQNGRSRRGRETSTKAPTATARSAPTRSKVGKKPGSKEKQPGEQKALKMQRALSHVSYSQRTDTKEKIATLESFSDFNLLPIVQEAIPIAALKGLTDISSTPIQRLAIASLLGQPLEKPKRRRRSADAAPQTTPSPQMQQYLLAAETGSGKTLAYLLPTIDAIKRNEVHEATKAAEDDARQTSKEAESVFALPSPPLSSEEDVKQRHGRPRAVILLPTAELVDQVGGLFKQFAHVVKLRVAMISASYSATVVRNRLYNPNGIDVLISTPHLLSSIASSDPNVLARVNHLIIDEADSLLDRSFAPLTSAVIDRATPSLQRLILCSATIPRSLDDYLRTRFPNINRLATPNLHAIPRRVQLNVVELERDPYRGNRALACADTIWSIGRSGAEGEREREKRILVFVNTRDGATELAGYLKGKGVDAVALNRDTAGQRDEDVLEAFTKPGSTPAADNRSSDERSVLDGPTPSAARRTLPNVKVLVLTDIGSRGIDTVPVRHVVLYDVPHTSIDFIHRLGRLGRMGRRGRGYVLVGKEDRRDVVKEVRESMFLGKALL
ncbi:MAG: RNA helicase [Chrysothrix sp. TS-e1954]|nr:MAG: RNA helicase [Chrysothrix sp. TS-e1954]